MGMKRPSLAVSLVTYTYNDHALAAGLLAEAASWEGVPRECVVVDDGSAVPFAAPDTIPAPRVLRLFPNQGPARAKTAGLEAGNSRFLLSVDADIRLPPDWLVRCLAEAARPEVGVVATPILEDAGEGLLGAYQRLRYSLGAGFSGEANVVPGGVWLLRREVWRRHSFHDYPKRLHVDVHFSQTLRAAGLSLRILPGPPARQIRRLSRLTMVRRGWTWQGPEFQAAAKANPIDPANALLVAVGRRMERHRAANSAFIYYDCLYLAHALADILGQAGYVADAAALPAVLAGVLPDPRAGAYLLADLARLGHAAGSAGQASPLAAALGQGLASLLPPDAEAALAAAVPELAAEDAREDWDFSFYDGLSSGAKESPAAAWGDAGPGCGGPGPAVG